MKEKNKKRSWKQIVSILSCIVVFCTTYALILPAVTLSTDTFCGKEEHTHSEKCYRSETPLCGLEEGEGSEGHTHTEDCYGNVEVGRNLICGMEEVEGHVHDDSCYQSEFEYGLICGKEESEPTEGHVHNEDCYISETPICGQEEHKHSRECYSNKEDVEDPKDWEEAYKDINKEEDAKTRILTVAKNEVGYKENEANFTVDENDAEHYYTRYGHLYEDMYGDWNNYFTGYVLKYANVKMNFDKDISKWQNKTIDDQKEEGEEGNVVFFRDDEGELRSGIVTKVDDLTKEIRVIEGDVDGQVKEERVNKDKVIAYLSDEVTIEDEDTPLAGDGVEKEDSRIVKTAKDANETVEVTAKYDPETTGITDEYEFRVTVLSDPETDDVQYDIGFYDPETNEEFEPKDSVEISIKYLDGRFSDEENLNYIHYLKDGSTETINSEIEVNEEGILESKFMADSFSLYQPTVDHTKVEIQVGESKTQGNDKIKNDNGEWKYWTGSRWKKIDLKDYKGDADIFSISVSKKKVEITGNIVGVTMLQYTYDGNNYYWDVYVKEEEELDYFQGVNADNVTLKLFDYDSSVNYSGGKERPFTFYNSKTGSTENTKGIFHSNDATASKKLVNGYPDISVPGYDTANIGYLFTKPYAILNGGGKLFQQREDGTYYYNSNNHAAYYNAEEKEFHLYGKPNSGITVAPNYDQNSKNFFPFNKLTTKTAKLNNNKAILRSNENIEAAKVNLWFGMEVTFDFLMPENGIIKTTNANGSTTESDMIFKFSGDDDVFVYIDDNLVIDLGGYHGAQEATINFKTGVVTTEGNVPDSVKSKTFVQDGKTAYYIKDLYDSTYSKLNGNTYKNYSTHSFKFIYFERGGNISNCNIAFNMPTVPSNSLMISKELEETGNNKEVIDYVKDTAEYTFKVFDEKDESQYIKDGAEYNIYYSLPNGTPDETKPIISENVSYSHENGIVLKAGQVAVFRDLQTKTNYTDIGSWSESKYYIEEWLPKISSGAYAGVSYEIQGAGGNTTQGEDRSEQFDTFKSNPLNNPQTNIVRFINTVDISKLSVIQIKKEMASDYYDENAVYRMKVSIDGQPITHEKYKVGDSEKNVIFDEKGNSFIEIKANETASLLTGALSGSKVNVEEVGLNNDLYENPTYSATLAEDNIDKTESGWIVEAGKNLLVTVTNDLKDLISRVKLHKVGKNNVALPNAEFELYKESSTGIEISVGDGTKVKVDKVETDIKSGPDGSYLLKTSLELNKKYYLVETSSPAGYYLLEKPILLINNGNQLDVYNEGITKDTPDQSVLKKENTHLVEFNVQNKPGTSLPNTGGAGTKLFTFSGAAVIAASGLMYGYKKKKDKRNGKGGLRK